MITDIVLVCTSFGTVSYSLPLLFVPFCLPLFRGGGGDGRFIMDRGYVWILSIQRRIVVGLFLWLFPIFGKFPIECIFMDINAVSHYRN